MFEWSPVCKSTVRLAIAQKSELLFALKKHICKKHQQQPRSQGLSSSLSWSGRKKEGEKRDPGNEVASTGADKRDHNATSLYSCD